MSWPLRISILTQLMLAGGPGPGPVSAVPLRWGADAEGGAPYIFKDPDDPRRHIGFEVDLAAALGQRLGTPIEFHQYEFDSLIQGLDRGDLDLAMNGLEVTPDRARRIRFSRPYYIYRLQLVVRSDESRFDDLAGCRRIGGEVATLGDTAASRLLEQEQVRMRLYNGQAEPYQDLLLGRVDAVLMDLPIAIYYARPNAKLRFAGEPFGEGYYAIAFPQGSEELARRFDVAISEVLESGELRRICEKWGIWTNDQDRLAGGEALVDVLKDSARKWTLRTYLPLLMASAWVTVKVSVLSMALAMALGLPIAAGRLYGSWPLKWAATVYVEFFRGIPTLLLLYFLYYGIPHVLQTLDIGVRFAPTSFTVAILAFGMNYAAYEAEIYRAGLSSIPVGQWEAAASLGMTPGSTFWRIIFPQALRVIIPPVTNDFVALFKDTSLVSVIAVVELTKQYLLLSKSSQKYFEIGLATAVLYLCMSVPLGYLARRLENIWGRRIPNALRRHPP